MNLKRRIEGLEERLGFRNPWVALVYVVRKRSVLHPYSRLRWTADAAG
jgi:hypothetical protein